MSAPWSLLRPFTQREATWPLHAPCVRDLGLETTVAVFQSSPHTNRQQIREILLNLSQDIEIIRHRQAVLADLWQHPPLTQRLEALLPQMSALKAYRSAVDRDRSTLQEVTWRLGELEHFVECVKGLHEVFTQIDIPFQAKGLRQLRQRVTQTMADPTYQNMARELPQLLQRIRRKASVTIGINLDNKLRPIAATLLAVNEQPFEASSFLDKLFGQRGQGMKGLGPLHVVPDIDAGLAASREWGHREFSPLMVPLFKDLAEVLETVSQPIARTLEQYVALQTDYLAVLSDEISFFLAAVKLRQRLEAHGLPLCQPEILPADARLCEISQGYNLNLALQLLSRDEVLSLVLNEAMMNEDGRILILTGPNQGGKTTYTQMIGLCQVLAQAGLWVPAQTARISLVDGIYTHYPAEESLEKATGRFGDEAQRLGDVFAHATAHSLILLNESLSSTSHGEGLYLARDVARILRRMGTRAVFGTHFHELAAGVDDLNRQTEGDSLIVSLVASTVLEHGDSPRRSYRIVRGQPLGQSYAREIAARYGVSYEQLLERLAVRGVIESS